MSESQATSRHTPRPSRSVNLASLLPAAIAGRYDAVPVGMDGATVIVATSSPMCQAMERDLEFTTGRAVRLKAETPQRVAELRHALYGPDSASSDQAASRVSWPEASFQSVPSSSPIRGGIVDLLDRILLTAIDKRASDVHFDPHDGTLVVRHRVDGVLRDMESVPQETAAFLLSRLKVLAGLDIADRVRPQDGRASVRIDGRAVDLRVSTLPLGAALEKAVVRILDASGGVSLDGLGLLPRERHQVSKLLAQTEGLVLVTGPTGSGKTTTLYSMLRATQSRETNVVTVEDPIEYRLEGVNQVQVNERAGLTFASALRSILRQDPDVVLVGEIRDAETAGIAVKASLTGHLVLSTLHTNDAASTVARLIDIGTDAGALAGALRGIVAQRLVRRLCDECSVPLRLDDLPAEQQLILAGKDTSRLRGAVGCARCSGSGYYGRTVVAEVLVITDELRRAISQRVEADEVQRLARDAGARSLWDAGVERVLDGTTSLHEVVDNLAAPVPSSDDTSAVSMQANVDEILERLRASATPTVAPAAERAVRKSAAVDEVSVKRITSQSRVIRRTASPHAAAGRTAPLRVLLVDDDRVARKELRERLQLEGYAVIEAHDGEAALAYTRRLRPDVIVTEIATPGIDAAGLLQNLAAEDHRATVVVYTEQQDVELHDWLRELGASDVIVRGDPSALIARLRVSIQLAA